MTFGQRLRSRLWRPRVEDEVDAEFEFHVEMRTREFIARGMDPGAARAAAVQRFGDINRVNQACRSLGRQRDDDMRRTEYFSALVQDVTFAFRHFVAQPGFTIVALLTLAIGIGATSAIFSAVHAVVLKPLPYPAPERLVNVYEDYRGRPGGVSAGNFTDVRAAATTFDGLAAAQYSSFNLTSEGAASGRALNDQDRRGALKVMVISEALAQAAWPNLDPVGRRMACCEARPDGTPDYKTVVGVAGDVRSNAPGDAPTPEFYLPIAQLPPEAWAWTQRPDSGAQGGVGQSDAGAAGRLRILGRNYFKLATSPPEVFPTHRPTNQPFLAPSVKLVTVRLKSVKRLPSASPARSGSIVFC